MSLEGLWDACPGERRAAREEVVCATVFIVCNCCVIE